MAEEKRTQEFIITIVSDYNLSKISCAEVKELLTDGQSMAVNSIDPQEEGALRNWYDGMKFKVNIHKEK